MKKKLGVNLSVPSSLDKIAEENKLDVRSSIGSSDRYNLRRLSKIEEAKKESIHSESSIS